MATNCIASSANSANNIWTETSEWNSFFNGIKEPNVTTLNTKERLYKEESVYIYRSLFFDITTNNFGGAVALMGNVLYNFSLLAEKTTFINCFAKGEGGAINSQLFRKCVLFNVCGYNCSTIGNTRKQICLFCYLSLHNNKESASIIRDSSIAYCKNSDVDEVITLNYGKNTVEMLNDSSNECKIASALKCCPNDYKGTPCNISYSFFGNNTASSYYILYLIANSGPEKGQYKISNCNIIENKEKERGILCCNRNTIIKDTCILNNNGNDIFCKDGNINITLDSCSISPDFKPSESIILINTPLTSFVKRLKFVKATNCVNIRQIVPTPDLNDYLGLYFYIICSYQAAFFIYTIK